MNKILIFILTTLLLVSVAASVTYENQYGKITVTPDVAYPHVGGVYQEAQFCSKVANTATIGISFLFDKPVQRGEIDLQNNGAWLDVTGQLTHATLNPRNYGFASDKNQAYYYDGLDFAPYECKTFKWNYEQKGSSGKWDMAIWAGSLSSMSMRWLLDPYYNNTWYENLLTSAEDLADISATYNITYGNGYMYLTNTTLETYVEISSDHTEGLNEDSPSNVYHDILASNNVGRTGGGLYNVMIANFTGFPVFIQITSCIVEVHINGDAGGSEEGISLQGVTSRYIGAITWNTAPTYDAEIKGTNATILTTTPIVANITASTDLCSGLYNQSYYGIRMIESSLGTARYYTIDGGASATRPKLYMTYIPMIYIPMNVTYGDIYSNPIYNVGTFSKANCSFYADYNNVNEVNISLSNDAGVTWFNNEVYYSGVDNQYVCGGSVFASDTNTISFNVSLANLGLGDITTPFFYNISIDLIDWQTNVTYTTAYDSIITENTTVNYSINITADASIVSEINTSFYYDGSLQPVVIGQYNISNLYVFEWQVNVPYYPTRLTDFTADAYFNYSVNTSTGTYTDAVVNLTQTVALTRVYLGICNTSQPFLIANYSVYDEQNSSAIINNFVTTSFSYYWQGRTGLTETYSNTSDNDAMNHEYCGTANGTFYVTPSISFNSQDYFQRNYATTETLYGNDTIIPLYLLLTSNGIVARFKTQNQYQTAIIGVLAVMKDSNNVTVETETTDSSGLASFFVNPNNYYTWTFSKVGYTTVESTQRITSSDIFTVQMTTPSDAVIGTMNGLNYFFTPVDTLLDNGTSYDFQFNLTSSYWNVTACLFGVYDENLSLLADSITGGSTTLYETGCNASITYNTGSYNTLILQSFIEENSTANVTVSQTYTVNEFYQGQYSLMTALDDMKNFRGAGFTKFTLAIIAFLIMLAIVSQVSEYINLSNPEVLVALIWSLIFLFSIIGWFSVGTSANMFAAWMNKYFIAFITGLITAGYIMWRHT